MMKRTLVAAAAALWLAAPGTAMAQDLAFDCDVEAGRFSSITFDTARPLRISGTIEPVEMRSGDTLPVAGVRLARTDGSHSFGFQLIAPSPRSPRLDVFFNDRGAQQPRRELPPVSAEGPIPFALSIAADGTGELQVAETVHRFESRPFAPAQVMVFCSTGQFKFAGLAWEAPPSP
ncbi:hypothetical protein [Pelagerythrobacter marinus]|uniref:hypothetical protein n=1 Tax=Pelagerythrobacter marinus TaxID=538382 RepID=UPI0020376395|nr:hypothetical protein [Pelagerythrobacter marinus]USA39013.1 hypothetical protein NCF86_11980 [Pelagerythrobacter marinus]WPZ06902.1 hypothetical protein T8T98_16120 [Pelagerythrobacter marinus]